MLFDLPTSVFFGGKEWDIDPDFRQVLRILEAMEDPDLTDGEKATVCLVNLYVDWTQDAPLILPAVNRAAGFEVRSADFLHWWTFLGYFMEIKDSVYSTVLSLRGKKARHKKLEKSEQEFWNENIGICRLKPKLTAEEQAEKERLKQILG